MDLRRISPNRSILQSKSYYYYNTSTNRMSTSDYSTLNLSSVSLHEITSSMQSVHSHTTSSPATSVSEVSHQSFDFGIFTLNLQEIQATNTEFDFYDPTEPRPIFPTTSMRTRLYQVPSTHLPNYADHWTIGFPNPNEWERVWNGRQYNLDSLLLSSRSIRNGENMPWTYEHTFKGAMYRLTLDHQQMRDHMPFFTHGTIISVQNWNCQVFRYIVDHCVYTDEHNAYLKVICFEISNSAFDMCSLRPPIILVVPLRFSKVRMHPNLDNRSNISFSYIKTKFIKLFHKLRL